MQRKVRGLSADQDDGYNQEFLLGSLIAGTVESASSDWFKSVELNGCVMNFKLDTVSVVNILPEQQVSKWKPQPTVRATKAKVTTYLGEQLNIENECELSCFVKVSKAL